MVREWRAVLLCIVGDHLKLGSENCLIVMAYVLGSENIEEERDEFWASLSNCVNELEHSE
jgi:hypothetical protein